MGILAAKEAWLDADAALRPPDVTRVGIYAGTSYGLLDELSHYETDLARRAFRAARPSVYQELTLGALTGHISIALDIRGPILPLGHGWLSAFQALDLAVAGLQDGTLDAALVVAVEALGTNMIARMREEAPALENIGEGAIALLIERREHPPRRRCAAYCWLGDAVQQRAGGATSHPEALAGAMSAARGADPAPLDGIFGLGGVGSAIDRLESSALALAFGDDLVNLHVTSTGALIGHTASCGALFNLAAAALASRHGELPATNGGATPAYATRVCRATQTGCMLASGWSSHGQYAAMLIHA